MTKTLILFLAISRNAAAASTVTMMNIMDIREKEEMNREKAEMKPQYRDDTGVYNVISTTMSPSEADPFLKLDSFPEDPLDGASVEDVPRFCKSGNGPGFDAIIYAQDTHVLDDVDIDNLEFDILVDSCCEVRRHHGAISSKALEFKKLQEGTGARVLAGKAFDVAGRFDPQHGPVHIVDFEMNPFTSLTVRVPEKINTVIVFVYQGELTRINGVPEWIRQETVVLLDATSSEQRGVSFESQGYGAKVLLLAGKKLHHRTPAAENQDIESDFPVFLRQIKPSNKASTDQITLVCGTGWSDKKVEDTGCGSMGAQESENLNLGGAVAKPN